MGSFDAAGLLPGMGAFRVAAGLASPVSPMPGGSRAPSSTPQPQAGSSYTLPHSIGVEFDDNRGEGYFPPVLDHSDFWNSSIHDHQDPESFSFTNSLAGSLLSEEITSDLELPQGAQGTEVATAIFDTGPQLETNNFSRSESESLSHLDPFHTGDTPGPTMALTSLLADMSQTETRLSKLTESELGNYPIGEVLYLCSSFHSIITESSSSSGHLIGPPDPSVSLLIICCHMSLLRIYSSVFDHLLRDMSDRQQEQPLAGQQRPHSNHIHRHHLSQTSNDSRGKKHKTPVSRGLSLDQLQSQCLCTTWSPTRKAVSMLVGSFREVEEVLQLPSDLLVTGETAADAPGTVDGFGTSLQGSEGKPAMSSEGNTKGSSVFYWGELIDGQLYNVVRTLVGNLGNKVQDMS
jgi:hypothetical protein